MTITTLNVPRAAAVLCVHPNRVLEMIADGTLPAAKIGRAWVLMERDVLDFVERQILAQTQARRFGSARPKLGAGETGRRAA